MNREHIHGSFAHHNGHNARLMHDPVTVIIFSLITIVTLASFIQLRDVVCLSYDYTAFLSNRSVCITHDEKHVLLRNTEYVERWYCYLFIGYIFIYMT